MAFRIVVIAFMGLLAIAGADAGTKLQAAGGEGGGRGDAGPVATKVITGAPCTFAVELADEARQRLEANLAQGSLDVARLVIRDLRPRAAQALKGVRIFVEKPDANAATPVDDPHYAGNFVLGLEASQSMLLNIAPTLSKLWHSGELTPERLAGKSALRITFVPERWDYAAALPREFALQLGGLTVEVPRRP
jgi:hypothetical protein